MVPRTYILIFELQLSYMITYCTCENTTTILVPHNTFFVTINFAKTTIRMCCVGSYGGSVKLREKTSIYIYILLELFHAW